MRSNKVPAQATPAMLEVVEDQLTAGVPPETRIAFDRLQGLGTDRQEAVRLIACVMADEIFNVMKYGEEFNLRRFASNLERLPEMPWD